MRHRFAISAAILALVAACQPARTPAPVQAPARADTSWVARSALYEVFVQDFSPSGDFRGVIAGLDRIQGTGANVVWLMPIHPIGIENRKGTLGSPYAARDYRAINPAYGTTDDFRDLVSAVHARGMKLILDWVPNHTAWDAVWVREHPDFHTRNDQGELTVPHDAEGKPTDWTDVAELNYANPALRSAMIEVMRYWLQEFNIDGFRVDVAGFVPYDFWREAVPALRGSVPRRILLLAEWGDLEMHRVGFDLTYGWDGYSRLKAVWKGDSAVTFVRHAMLEADSMPPGGMRLRFTTNHDETSWDKPPVTLFNGSAGARAAFVAIALLPGRPLLYNGQEVESPQVLNLFERLPVAWEQPGAAAARAFYKQVVELARTDSAFISGDFGPVAVDDSQDVIAYHRHNVVVLVNTRANEVRVTPAVVGLDGARDLLSGRVQHGTAVTLPPYGAVALKRGAR